jgi:uncharacterized OB-fold protein
MDSSHICSKCGRTMPGEQLVCRCGARPRQYWLHFRETSLLFAFSDWSLHLASPDSQRGFITAAGRTWHAPGSIAATPN